MVRRQREAVVESPVAELEPADDEVMTPVDDAPPRDDAEIERLEATENDHLEEEPPVDVPLPKAVIGRSLSEVENDTLMRHLHDKGKASRGADEL